MEFNSSIHVPAAEESDVPQIETATLAYGGPMEELEPQYGHGSGISTSTMDDDIEESDTLEESDENDIVEESKFQENDIVHVEESTSDENDVEENDIYVEAGSILREGEFWLFKFCWNCKHWSNFCKHQY